MKALLRILLFVLIAIALNAAVGYLASRYYVEGQPVDAQSELCKFWASLSFLSLPVGIALIVFGIAWHALKSWLPFAVGLASAVAINLVIFLIMSFGIAVNWPADRIGEWFFLTIPLGLLLIAIGLIWTLKDNIFVVTFLRLSFATSFALVVTIFFPLILLAIAIHLKRKRGIKFREVWNQGPYLYNFFIINVYPIFFQILPGLGLILRKGRAERKALKKEFKALRKKDPNLKPPVHESSLDLDKLEIGDVILSGKDSWSYSFPIQTSNLLSNGEENRFWTHAMIYAGNGKVLEAQINKGVIETALAETFFKQAYKLKVVRHRYLSASEREKVVGYCRDKQSGGCAYDTWGAGFYALASLIPPMLSGWLENEFAEKFFNVGDAYFCSELVAEAYQENGHDLFLRKSWRVKPLDFAFNPMFDEIDCGYSYFAVGEAPSTDVSVA